MEFFTIQECQDGFLYKLNSRNLVTGIWNAGTQRFVGIRSEYLGTDPETGAQYEAHLDSEQHWAAGVPFGTACPTEEGPSCPMELMNQGTAGDDALMEWIGKQRIMFGRRPTRNKILVAALASDEKIDRCMAILNNHGLACRKEQAIALLAVNQSAHLSGHDDTIYALLSFDFIKDPPADAPANEKQKDA